eukprot:CAMPEP_0202069720 /NCGR_PEP_ID=MMETSP0964-20121228/667_1 /ASSEMBLY_ACC=CAM_ASM_000500 /TAXON_ID=4773 /ORGANISM="Schizochytrium aggregatum, Strain ATCC28209" /LENGTH=327 /DNA_ID=CAMNT_0048636501 /DNA_START=37 /DNA_END=1019 /DNA_ORIENTATION=+
MAKSASTLAQQQQQQQHHQQQQQQQQQPLRAVISSSRLVNEHTEYRIELVAGAAKLSSVSRRFREFTELHAQLSKTNHAFPIPEVPPKKFFGRTNPEFVAKRQKELQVFLDQLVARIVAHPPAEAAWRLLCLFLSLDPKQDVPEAILNLADQSAGATGLAASASGANAAGSAAAASATGGAGLNDSAAGLDGAGGSGMLAGSDGEADGQYDQQGLEPDEMHRLEKVVEEFVRQVINVSGHADERLQMPSAAFLDKLPLDNLAHSIEKHLLSAPLFLEGKPKQAQTIEDNEATSEANQASKSYSPIEGAEELVVSLDMVGDDSATSIA